LWPGHFPKKKLPEAEGKLANKQALFVGLWEHAVVLDKVVVVAQGILIPSMDVVVVVVVVVVCQF
jgi:hypothetical protein